jgi:hypothetical protein
MSKVIVDLSILNDFQDRLKKNVLKKAVRAGAKLAVADMRTNVAVRTGALKKSISSKVDSPKGGLISYALIGPRSAYTMKIKGTDRIAKPSRYAHFTLKTKNFLTSAIAKTETYLKRIMDVLTEEINKNG